jgi:hypothetical protein
MKMKSYLPMFVLAVAIGCSQGSAPDAVTESTTDLSTVPASTEVAEVGMELPGESATKIEFFCPGMT